MIIKEADVVITHFGIQGMRWGVRKDRYAQNRAKAKNILNAQSGNKEMNKNDLKAAEWMSKSIPDKVASELFQKTVKTIVFQAAPAYLVSKSSFKDKKVLLSIASKIVKDTATEVALKEASASVSLRR